MKRIDLLNFSTGEWYEVETGSEYLNGVSRQDEITNLKEHNFGTTLEVDYKNGDVIFYNNVHGTWGNPFTAR